MKTYYVYIITNQNNNVLYTGITSNIEKRMYEHKNKIINGFSSKYNLTKLVYVEQCGDANEAISYEKKIKGVTRSRKIELIEESNKNWEDLST